jgi:glucokinase
MGYLACGMANIINTFQPEILCVGGGVGNEKENLLGPVRKLVEAQVYSIHARKQTKICAAELGNDAGIIGAALLTE